MEFLYDMLMERGYPIKAMRFTLLKEYSTLLSKEYNEVFDHISSRIVDDDIMELEKYIKTKINGTFTQIMEEFIHDYQSN